MKQGGGMGAWARQGRAGQTCRGMPWQPAASGMDGHKASMLVCSTHVAAQVESPSAIQSAAPCLLPSWAQVYNGTVIFPRRHNNECNWFCNEWVGCPAGC